MKQEHEYGNTMIEMPKFCPECGGEMAVMLKVPNGIDADEGYEEYMLVCTMCTHEEDEIADGSFLDWLDQQIWRPINNVLPDVTYPEKVHIHLN